METKVLFLIKKRYSNLDNSNNSKFGLFNSCKFVSDYLISKGISSDVRETEDGDTIDAVVTKVNPTHVFIEALWCPTSKLEELLILHSQRKWIVRIHSQLAFLEGEGDAFFSIREIENLQKKYKNLELSVNSRELQYALNHIGKFNITFTPNLYPLKPLKHIEKTSKDIINIACFGALRSFKNISYQAVCAIILAERLGKTLNFYINSTTSEADSLNIHKSLNNIFKNTQHKLFEVEWLDHSDFCKKIAFMDIGMQVSYTETFNIVTADFISASIPIVVSESISWMNERFKSKPDSVEDTVKIMFDLYKNRSDYNVQYAMYTSLMNIINEYQAVWNNYFSI